MQDEFTGENVVKELLKLLDPEINRETRAQLRDVSLKLGAPGASQRAAESILHFIRVNPRP